MYCLPKNFIFLLRVILLLIGLSLLNSCSHFVKNQEEQFKLSHTRKTASTSYKSLKNKDNRHPYGEIHLDHHPNVDMWLRYFTGRGRKQMAIYLERSSRYLPMMKNILKENELPLDLVYVALIESGFSPKAMSQANAVGYWQFIYGTGKRYGLRIDGFVDERRDPVLSTKAAANYFKDLYSLFGSWPLALAAYNAGEYRINRAVLKYYNRDFWFLSSKKALPRETRNYLPKYLAAIMISKNPEQYGFTQINYQDPIKFELFTIKKPISLVKLATHLNISPKTIKTLNPMYKGNYVPVYKEKTTLRVPVDKLSLALASAEKSFMKEPKQAYYSPYWYRVRKGDNLSAIARKYRTSVTKLKRANNMGRSSFLRVGKKLKIPNSKRVATKKTRSKALASLTKEFHVVRKGHSLSYIARTNGLKLAQLKQLNNIQGNPLIQPGQKIRIKRRNLASVTKKIKSKNYHIVQKGDTLIGIAKKYNISLPKLMTSNSMSLKSVLLTGRHIIIPNIQP